MKPLETVLRTFVELHPDDAARAFEALPPTDGLRLLKSMPIQVAAPLVERLAPHWSAPLLEQLPPERLCDLLKALPLRVGSMIVKHIGEEKRQEVLAALPETNVRWLRELAEFPPDSAGGMMEPKVVSLALDLTAQQATSAIRKAPREALHYLYVTRRDGQLVGVLNMRDLLLASPRDPIEPIVRQPVLSVMATMPRDEVIDLMTERRFLALPVVDADNRLIGVVKHDRPSRPGSSRPSRTCKRSWAPAATNGPCRRSPRWSNGGCRGST